MNVNCERNIELSTNNVKEFYETTKKLVIKLVEDENNKTYTQYVDNSLLSTYPDISLPIYEAVCKSSVNWKSCGLRASNFVYGEVDMFDIYEIIMKHIIFEDSDNIRLQFTSLGCGSGPCMAAAYFSNKFQSIVGVDLMKAKIRECECLFALFSNSYYENHPILGKKIEFCYSSDVSNNIIDIDKDDDIFNSTFFKIIYGNFVNDYDWSQSHVVYCCATCLSLDVQNCMTEACLKMRKNSYVILIDNDTILSQSKQETSMHFVFVNSSSIACSWGMCTAYVYKKIT